MILKLVKSIFLNYFSQHHSYRITYCHSGSWNLMPTSFSWSRKCFGRIEIEDGNGSKLCARLFHQTCFSLDPTGEIEHLSLLLNLSLIHLMCYPLTLTLVCHCSPSTQSHHLHLSTQSTNKLFLKLYDRLSIFSSSTVCCVPKLFPFTFTGSSLNALDVVDRALNCISSSFVVSYVNESSFLSMHPILCLRCTVKGHRTRRRGPCTQTQSNIASAYPSFPHCYLVYEICSSVLYQL